MPRSHPTGVRGLKLRRRADGKEIVASHPTGVRGLKLSHPYSIVPRVRRTPRGCVD